MYGRWRPKPDSYLSMWLYKLAVILSRIIWKSEKFTKFINIFVKIYVVKFCTTE